MNIENPSAKSASDRYTVAEFGFNFFNRRGPGKSGLHFIPYTRVRTELDLIVPRLCRASNLFCKNNNSDRNFH